MNEIGTDRKLSDLQKNVAGVYHLYRSDTRIYIGQTLCIRSRIFTHIKEGRKQFDAYSFFPINDTLKRLNFFDGLQYLNWVEAYEINLYTPPENAVYPNFELLQARMRVELINFCYEVLRRQGPATEEEYALLTPKTNKLTSVAVSR
jgi:hypothetical protein